MIYHKKLNKDKRLSNISQEDNSFDKLWQTFYNSLLKKLTIHFVANTYHQSGVM